jgi:hypothetical protein
MQMIDSGGWILSGSIHPSNQLTSIPLEVGFVTPKPCPILEHVNPEIAMQDDPIFHRMLWNTSKPAY